MLFERLIYHPHARDRMMDFGISERQVRIALEAHHTRIPAAALSGRSFRSTIYIGTVDGRDLKVYIEDGSDPPLVRTISWRGQR